MITIFMKFYLIGFLIVGIYGCWEAGHIMSYKAWLGCFFGWWYRILTMLVS